MPKTGASLLGMPNLTVSTARVSLLGMRKLALLGVALFSFAALAIGINLDQSVIFTFASCASGGSSAQTIPVGTYLTTVTGSDTTLCQADSASTCSSGGTILPLGTSFLWTAGRGGFSVSCRSSASGGTLQFTRTRNE